jgi:putative membrane protein
MIEWLPALNACLNLTSALLLVRGRSRIRAGDRQGHRKFMLSAVWVSVAFLTSYLVYHYFHGSTRFPGEGVIRPLYFAMLTSHTILAAVNVPLVAFALYHALGERFDVHRRIARWAYPVWVYVSVTGVLIYLLLYQVYGPL